MGGQCLLRRKYSAMTYEVTNKTVSVTSIGEESAIYQIMKENFTFRKATKLSYLITFSFPVKVYEGLTFTVNQSAYSHQT